MEIKDFLSNYEKYLNKEAVKEDTKSRKKYFGNKEYDFDPLAVVEDDAVPKDPDYEYPLNGAILSNYYDIEYTQNIYGKEIPNYIYHGRNPITGGHILSDEKDFERFEIDSGKLQEFAIEKQGSGDKEWYDKRNYDATLREMEAMGFSKGGRLKKFLGDAYETGRKVTFKAKEKAREGIHNASKRNTMDVLGKMKKDRDVTDNEVENIKVTEDVVQDHYLFEPKTFVPRKSDGKNISGVVEITPKKEMGGGIEVMEYEVYTSESNKYLGNIQVGKNADRKIAQQKANKRFGNPLLKVKIKKKGIKSYADGGGVKKKRKEVPNITYTATIQVVDAKGKEQPTAIPTLEMTLSSDKSVAEVKDIFKESIEQSAGFKKGNQVEITDFYLGSMETPEEERVYFDFKEEEEEAENFEPRVKRSGKWDESYSTLCDELATYNSGGKISKEYYKAIDLLDMSAYMIDELIEEIQDKIKGSAQLGVVNRAKFVLVDIKEELKKHNLDNGKEEYAKGGSIEDEEKGGQEIADFLSLRIKKANANNNFPHYETSWGTKTDVGLFNSMLRLLQTYKIDAEKGGQAIAEMVYLKKKKPNANNNFAHYETSWGTKTDVGLYNSISRIVEENS